MTAIEQVEIYNQHADAMELWLQQYYKWRVDMLIKDVGLRGFKLPERICIILDIVDGPGVDDVSENFDNRGATEDEIERVVGLFCDTIYIPDGTMKFWITIGKTQPPPMPPGDFVKWC